MSKIIVPCLLVFCFSLNAQAQYTLCNGKYTNKPCGASSDAAQPVVTPSVSNIQESVANAAEQSSSSAKPTPSKTPQTPPFSERYALVREVKKSSEDRKASGQKSLSSQELEELRQVCQNPNVAYDECKKRADALEEQLKKINAADNVITMQDG